MLHNMVRTLLLMLDNTQKNCSHDVLLSIAWKCYI